MYGHPDGMFFGGGVFMWVFWIVLLIVLVFVIKLIFSPTGKNSSSSDEALEILKKRFAKGEIDEEEFERLKKKLE